MSASQNSSVVTMKSRRKSSRRAVSMDEAGLIEIKPLFDDPEGAVIIEAQIPGISLADWSRDKLEYINDILYKQGAILYRGFATKNDQDFVDFMETFPYSRINYLERSTPRKEISKSVYTSTMYPPEEVIALHNENSAAMTIALKLWFFCCKPSEVGGATPIANSRRILNAIDKEVLGKFKTLGWKLVRNYGNNMGYSWKAAFDGMPKEEIEKYFNANNVSYEWKNDGGLRTEQTRPATILHPKTGVESWFNHMSFWHRDNLPAEVLSQMLNQFGDDGLPFDTFYGDGTVIPTEVAHHIRDAYLKEKKLFTWMKGDVLYLDNIMTSHGRETFKGDRVVRVAMADAHVRTDIR